MFQDSSESDEKHSKYNESSEETFWNARRWGKRTNIVNPRHTDLRKSFRRELCSFMFQDSSESDEKHSFYNESSEEASWNVWRWGKRTNIVNPRHTDLRKSFRRELCFLMFQDSLESDEKHSKYIERTGDSDKSETYREQWIWAVYWIFIKNRIALRAKWRKAKL
jgi:hypothetical protein